MFHHYQELETAHYLVRSTALTYAESPIAWFITSAIQSVYARQSNRSYLKKSMPPLEFTSSEVPKPEQLAQQPPQEVNGPRQLTARTDDGLRAGKSFAQGLTVPMTRADHARFAINGQEGRRVPPDAYTLLCGAGWN